MMQRQLHLSLRRLCCRQCDRRLHSAQAAITQYHRSEPRADVVTSTELSEVAGSAEHLDASTLRIKESLQPKRMNNQLPFPPDSGESRSAPNKVDAYLASLRAEGIEPTLKDLLRLTPKKVPSVKSRGYAPAYTELIDRLCRTFSKSQLRRFCQDLGLDHRYSMSNKKKIEYAEAIMEKEWGWENLKEVEKRKRDASEVVRKSFPVSASELFLLLGKDGSELLQISRDYNVHISVTPDPLSIRIEGLRASIRKLEAMIFERRKSIIEEMVDLPTGEPLTHGFLQQVSRTANAFIENVGDDGKIRIRANSQRRLLAAKRLVLRAAVQIRHSVRTPCASLLPPPPSAVALDEPTSYSLFPFAPQHSLPWTNISGCVFRSRTVNDWLGDRGKRLASFSADLSGRKGRLIGIDGEISALENIITRTLGDAAGPYMLNASTGHVLIMPASQQNQPSILPPLTGCWQFHELLDWMRKDDSHRIFVPCLPSVLHSSPPTHEKIVHRLTYRHVQSKLESPGLQSTDFDPMKVIHAEVVINRQKLEEPETPAVEPVETLNKEEESTRSELDDIFIDGHLPTDLATEENSEMSPQTSEQVSNDADVAEDIAALSRSQPATSDEDKNSERSGNYLEKEVSFDVEVHGEGRKHTDNPEPMTVDQSMSAVEFYSDLVCRKGRELELLVSLPDRPMDLKVTVLGSVDTMSVREIPELSEYFEALRAYLENSATESSPPEPPLFIEQGNDRYILDLNASIRQSTETLVLRRGDLPELDAPSLDGLGECHISTMTESIYDLESGQRFINCQISCKASPSDDEWAIFLENIDLLTVLGYKTKRAPENNFFSVDDSPSNDADGRL